MSCDLELFNLESRVASLSRGVSSLSRRLRPGATPFGADGSASGLGTVLVGPAGFVSDCRFFTMMHLE